VQLAAFGLEHAGPHARAPGPQAAQAPATHLGVGVAVADVHVANPRLEQGIGAGTRPALVGAGLKGDRHRGSANRALAMAPPRCRQGNDLGMRPSGWTRRTASENPIAAEDHGTHRRVRSGATQRSARSRKGATHGFVGRHSASGSVSPPFAASFSKKVA
jgi:hypothetical protein